MTPPILETDRLILRAHRVADFADLAAIWADPVVVRHIGGKPSTGEQSWARLLRYAGHWALLDYGFWAIEERASGRLAGEIGAADFQRAIAPPIAEPECGWVLASWAHGRGYATEALRAALGWLDARFAALACIIDVGNAASHAVATKAGFVAQGTTTYLDEAVIRYRRG